MIYLGLFFVNQFLEKCHEQNMPLYIAFIDYTKAFDLVSRVGLFAILLKVRCPPNIFNLLSLFFSHKHMGNHK